MEILQSSPASGEPISVVWISLLGVEHDVSLVVLYLVTGVGGTVGLGRRPAFLGWSTWSTAPAC